MKDAIKEIALTVPGGDTIRPIAGMPSGGLLTRTIPAAMTYLFLAAGLLALFFLIFGGIRWITSGGDKQALDTARKTIMYAIIGLIIVFLSYFIVITIGTIFRVKLINF